MFSLLASDFRYFVFVSKYELVRTHANSRQTPVPIDTWNDSLGAGKGGVFVHETE